MHAEQSSLSKIRLLRTLSRVWKSKTAPFPPPCVLSFESFAASADLHPPESLVAQLRPRIQRLKRCPMRIVRMLSLLRAEKQRWCEKLQQRVPEVLVRKAGGFRRSYRSKLAVLHLWRQYLACVSLPRNSAQVAGNSGLKDVSARSRDDPAPNTCTTGPRCLAIGHIILAAWKFGMLGCLR
jgi:hypothetical protein